MLQMLKQVQHDSVYTKKNHRLTIYDVNPAKKNPKNRRQMELIFTPKKRNFTRFQIIFRPETQE
jgi:hypothetical protein